MYFKFVFPVKFLWKREKLENREQEKKGDREKSMAEEGVEGS